MNQSKGRAEKSHGRQIDGVSEVDGKPASTSANTIVCPIHAGALNTPDATAVWSRGGKVNYAELDAAVSFKASQMTFLEGNRIAIQSWNSIDLIVTLFAAWRLKCLVLLFSPRVPQNEMDTYLLSNGAQSILVRGDVVTGDVPLGEGMRASEKARPLPKSTHGPKAHQEPKLFLDHPATAMLTSGSTGTPELVVHSLGNHVSSAQSAQTVLHVTPADSWLLSLPCFHVGGLAILWRCFIRGASVRIPTAQAFDTKSYEGAPPTIWSVVPAQLFDIVKKGARSPDTLRSVIVGGAPITEALLGAAINLGFPVRTSYGLTESSSMVCLSDIWEDVRQPIHAGKPLHGVNLTFSEGGSVNVDSDSVCIGNLKNGSIEPQSRPLSTQDNAEMTAGGCLRVFGRADDIIISGGENISARAIERAIMALDGLIFCTVVQVDHSRYGKRPVAFVQTQSGVVDEAQIKNVISSTLTSISVPDRILPMPIPEPGTLKVTRAQLSFLAQSAV